MYISTDYIISTSQATGTLNNSFPSLYKIFYTHFQKDPIKISGRVYFADSHGLPVLAGPIYATAVWPRAVKTFIFHTQSLKFPFFH